MRSSGTPSNLCHAIKSAGLKSSGTVTPLGTAEPLHKGPRLECISHSRMQARCYHWSQNSFVITSPLFRRIGPTRLDDFGLQAHHELAEPLGRHGFRGLRAAFVGDEVERGLRPFRARLPLLCGRRGVDGGDGAAHAAAPKRRSAGLRARRCYKFAFLMTLPRFTAATSPTVASGGHG